MPLPDIVIYTDKVTPCGLPGSQIQISALFIQSFPSVEVGQPSKLLSSWAKYRWGVFDELGIDDFESFYNEKYEVENVRCSKTRSSVMFMPKKENNKFCRKLTKRRCGVTT
jgi:hypothetical protein